LKESVSCTTCICAAGLAVKASILEGALFVPEEHGGLKAAIAIDADAGLHRINPNIYGALIEHVGRCVYGGVYQENSPLSDEQRSPSLRKHNR
jgi:alpha-N-arabinofuranosidase